MDESLQPSALDLADVVRLVASLGLAEGEGRILPWRIDDCAALAPLGSPECGVS